MLTAARLQFHALTHQGLVRSRNEDAHQGCPLRGFAVLADGMGGSPAGDVAAQVAVSIVTQALNEGLELHPALMDSALGDAELVELEGLMRRAVAQANATIYTQSRAEPGCAGMGTTLLVAVWRGRDLLVGHVGDSRAYRLRPRHWALPGGARVALESMRLTRDHNRGSEHRGAWSASAPAATAHIPDGDQRLTRAIGIESDVVLELHRHRLEPHDIVMLCSDGLTTMVDDTRIEQAAAAALQAQVSEDDGALALAPLCQALVDAALAAGGLDNITVILGSAHDETAETP